MSDSESKTTQSIRLGIALRSVQSLPGRNLRLEYEDGSVYILDFNPVIAGGGVMQSLQDDAVFSQVTIAHGGIAIEFPGEIDFCADALRIDAEQQKSSGT